MNGRPAVLLVLFNRPALVAEQVERLRAMQPDTLIVAADGPRPGVPGEAALVAAARAELEKIDWPCRIVRDFAETNMGANERQRTGFALAFTQADRVAVLEDDIAAPANYLVWAQEGLDAVASRADFAFLSPHNGLGCWNLARRNHENALVPALRGSQYGLVTTRQSWEAVQSTPLDPATLRRRFADLDPLLAAHFTVLLTALDEGVPLSLDLKTSLRVIAADRRAYVSPVNLISNRGFGDGATRTKDPDALEAAIPVYPPPRPVHAPDPALSAGTGSGYERASLLFELLARWRRPALGPGLAAFTARRGHTHLSRRERLHLAPFETPQETLALVDHFARQGFEPLALKNVRAALTQRAAQVG